MARIERHCHILQVLSKCSKKQCKAILKTAESDLIKCLCECACNIIKGNVQLTSKQKSKLSKHKSHLRQLSDKRIPLTKKKNTLVKHGGALLPLMLPAVFSALSFLPKLFK